MSHVIFFLILCTLLLIPVAAALYAEPQEDQADWPKPPTDEELFEFHRQVNLNPVKYEEQYNKGEAV